MKIQIEGQQPIIIGKRVALGQIIGAVLAWGFWLFEHFTELDIPAAMVIQAGTLFTGAVQIWIVHKFGVTK